MPFLIFDTHTRILAERTGIFGTGFPVYEPFKAKGTQTRVPFALL
jgi:hypothetical protein